MAHTHHHQLGHLQKVAGNAANKQTFKLYFILHLPNASSTQKKHVKNKYAPTLPTKTVLEKLLVRLKTLPVIKCLNQGYSLELKEQQSHSNKSIRAKQK